MRAQPASGPVTYVILDAGLQRADPPRFARLLAGFAAGYEATFHGDEAEPAARWPARIAGEPAPQPVLRVAVAVQGPAAAEQVIGGAAVEYYRASACVLCTYLYVLDRPEHRQRGHGRALLAAATRAFADLGNVQAVLAEVEWPDALPTTIFGRGAVEDARTRLRFFERLGARRIALDYVQPALDATSQPVPWLRLMRLPETTGMPRRDDAALRAALDRFLLEFHRALADECERVVDTALLAAQRAQVASADPLTVGIELDKALD